MEVDTLLDDTWIRDFEKTHDVYQDFYKTDLYFIHLTFIYINRNNEIDKIKNEPFILNKPNLISHEEHIEILKKNLIDNNKRYSLLSILRYNINLEPDEIKHFIQNGDVFVIESNFATTGRLDENNLKTISASYFQNVKRSECKAGDIIIAKIGANFGLCRILPLLSKPSLVSGNSMKLTLNSLILDRQYFNYFWLILKRKGVIDLLSKSTAQPALNLYQLADIQILIPPLSEQRAITDFLDHEMAKIDTLISKIEKQIELLNEYKQSLITHAVTGKIDVRTEVAINQTEEASQIDPSEVI